MTQPAGPLVAVPRMYDPGEPATQRWRHFFAWLAEAAGVDLQMVEMPPPAQLPDIWARADLGCAFMCALPFSSGRFDVQPLAAPVPLFPRYESRPVYATDFIVRQDSPARDLEDLRDYGPVALMPRDSLSGYRAPVAHLAERWGEDAVHRLLRDTVLPVQTPRDVLQSVAEGRAALGAVDSYFFDLCCHIQAPFAQDLQRITTTPWLPMSPLVASTAVDDKTVAALRAALLKADRDETVRGLLGNVGLSGFAEINPSGYTEAVGARYGDTAEASLNYL